MSETRVVVVEDEIILAKVIQEQVESLGYQVVGVTGSGEDAIRLVGSQRPSVVLMDIHLKGDMDGITAAGQIRTRYHVPVIYLTAYADTDTLARAKLTEPFSYLLKPFQPQELQGAIECAVYKHQMEQQLRLSEQRYRTTLTSIADAVFAVDRDKRLTFLNPAAEALTGWSRAEAVGRLLSEVVQLVHPQTRQRLASPIEGVR